MQPLGLFPLALGLFFLYRALISGKPNHRFGSGIGLTEQLVHRLPDRYWRIVMALAGACLLVAGVRFTWLGW